MSRKMRFEDLKKRVILAKSTMNDYLYTKLTYSEGMGKSPTVNIEGSQVDLDTLLKMKERPSLNLKIEIDLDSLTQEDRSKVLSNKKKWITYTSDVSRDSIMRLNSEEFHGKAL